MPWGRAGRCASPRRRPAGGPPRRGGRPRPRRRPPRRPSRRPRAGRRRRARHLVEPGGRRRELAVRLGGLQEPVGDGGLGLGGGPDVRAAPARTDAETATTAGAASRAARRPRVRRGRVGCSGVCGVLVCSSVSAFVRWGGKPGLPTFSRPTPGRARPPAGRAAALRGAPPWDPDDPSATSCGRSVDVSEQWLAATANRCCQEGTLPRRAVPGQTPRARFVTVRSRTGDVLSTFVEHLTSRDGLDGVSTQSTGARFRVAGRNLHRPGPGPLPSHPSQAPLLRRRSPPAVR